MSLLFGDDIFSDPFASRAFEDEDEDDLGNTPAGNLIPSIILNWSKGIKDDTSQTLTDIPCTSLIIALGRIATGFVQVYILESQQCEVIGSFHSVPVEAEGESSVKKEDLDCFIYSVKDRPGVILVQCLTEVKPEQSHSWTQRLLSSVRLLSAQVIILSSCGVGEYRSNRPPGDLPRNFLRALHSKSYVDKLVCPLLEQPNTLSGLAAQVLTYCHVHNVASVLYVCYTNTAQIDSDTLRSFDKLLSTAPFNQLTKENKNVNERLSAFVRLHPAHSSLYI